MNSEYARSNVRILIFYAYVSFEVWVNISSLLSNALSPSFNLNIYTLKQ